MRVCLVNLDSAKERLASSSAQLKKLGVSFERVSAVMGKTLSQADLEVAFGSFRWWCAMGRPVVLAEIGCALSHYKIYQQMLADEKFQTCCVLEDDVQLSPFFNSTLDAVAKWIDPNKPQVVLLNDHNGRYGEFPSGIHASCFGGACTDGYVLTRMAAKNLLEANLPIIVPCDSWGRWVRQGRIELYHAVPAVVRQMQDVFGTSTSEGRQDVAKLPLPLRLVHKFKRAVGKSLDACLVKVTGR